MRRGRITSSVIDRLFGRRRRRVRAVSGLGDICTIDANGGRVCVSSSPGGPPPPGFGGKKSGWQNYGVYVGAETAAGIPVQLPGQPAPVGSSGVALTTGAAPQPVATVSTNFDFSTIPTWAWLAGGVGAFLLLGGGGGRKGRR